MFARGFSDAAILHAGRAGALAGAAEQAKIEMFFETFVQFDPPIGCGFDQMNSAARRLRFETQHAIGRALIQTQAAMDALVELGEVERGKPEPLGLDRSVGLSQCTPLTGLIRQCKRQSAN